MSVFDKKYNQVSGLVPYLLFFPLFCRWLFPSSIEERLSVDFFSYPLFLPELSLFFIPLVRKIRIVDKKIIVYSFLGLVYLLFNAFINYPNNPFSKFFIGSDFFFSFFFFHFFSFSNKDKEKFFKISFLLLHLIGIQIILYSLGIVKYDGMNLDDNYGSITRFNSTVGAATGTSILTFLLGYISYNLARSNKLKRIILITTTVYILFTLSRGALIAQLLLILFVFFKNFKKNKMRTMIYIFFALLMLLIVDYKTGVLDGFTNRVERTQQSQTFKETPRGYRWGITVENISKKPIFGHGSAFMSNYNRGKYTDHKPKIKFSPHNSYLMITLDYGVIGLFLSLIVLFLMIKNSIVKNIFNETTFVLLIIVLFLMNIEIIFLTVEFIIPVLIISRLKRSNEKKNSVFNVP